MASKQQKAKEAQGYESHPVLPVCSNCQHYTSRIERGENSWGGEWEQEKDLRCGLGGFAIKKMAGCAEWELKA